MKSKVLPFLSLVLLFCFLLSACGSMPAPSWPGITMGKDNAYMASSQIYVIRPTDGAILGKFPEKAEAQGMYANPALGSDLVVAGDYANTLNALNANTMALVWKFSDAKSRYIAPATIVEKMVLAPNTDGNMYAIDLISGKELWKFSANSPLWSQALYDGKTVFLASLDHMLFAVDPNQSGKIVWKTDLGGAVVSTPLLDTTNNIIYAATLAKEVIAVNSLNGKILWRSKDLAEGIWSGPVMKDQKLYVGNSVGSIFALDTNDGKIIWESKISGGITGSGALAPEGIVFITEKGDAVMLEYEKGSVLWTVPTGLTTLYGSPVITANSILIGTTQSADTLMISLDFSGKKLWTLPVPK